MNSRFLSKVSAPQMSHLDPKPELKVSRKVMVSYLFCQNLWEKVSCSHTRSVCIALRGQGPFFPVQRQLPRVLVPAWLGYVYVRECSAALQWWCNSNIGLPCLPGVKMTNHSLTRPPRSSASHPALTNQTIVWKMLLKVWTINLRGKAVLRAEPVRHEGGGGV